MLDRALKHTYYKEGTMDDFEPDEEVVIFLINDRLENDYIYEEQTSVVNESRQKLAKFMVYAIGIFLFVMVIVMCTVM